MLGGTPLKRGLRAGLLLLCMLGCSRALAHLTTNIFVDSLPADSAAAVEAYLEATLGVDLTVTHHGSLDWATQGVGVGVSIAGDLSITVGSAADLDADGFPTDGIWELHLPFAPDINYQVVTFDAGSPIGVQYGLYIFGEGTDIFSAGFFQTDDYTDGSGPHGWTEFSIYNVEVVDPIITIDNNDPNVLASGTWNASSASGHWEADSLFANDAAATFRWLPGLDATETYEVYAWWTYHANRGSNVPYTIVHSGGSSIVEVSQNDPALGGDWVLLGTYSFSGDGSGYIEVSAANGQASADAVRLVPTSVPVNMPPMVSIDAPVDGASFTLGETVSLAGSASDTEDGVLDASISWRSSLDGDLGSGTPLDVSSLSLGAHTITAEVIDSGGANDEDAIGITVIPAGGAEIIVDNLDPGTSQSGTWNSSSAPDPWAGNSVFNNADNSFRWPLDVPGNGNYEVYAWWTYHVNRSTNVPYLINHAGGSDTVFVNQRNAAMGGQWVLLGNYAFAAGSAGYIEVSSENGQASADAVRLLFTGSAIPEVTITAPADGSSVTEGDLVSLEASAMDLEDGDISALVDWTSDIDGALGNGSPLLSSTLSVGMHTITAEATDSDGETGSDTLSLQVNPPGALEVIVDNDDAATSSTGTWKISGAADPWGANSVFNAAGDSFRWLPGLTESGQYAVYAWWTYHVNRSTNVPYRIAHSGGIATEYRNQRDPGLAGQWVMLGVYTFSGDGSGYVEISSENGQASADAVRLVATGSGVPEVIISAPADGSSVTEGDAVSLQASATDPEDGDITALVEWSSDIDGLLGSGSPLLTSALSPGYHTLTASVTDSDEETDSATINLLVNPLGALEVIVDNEDAGTSSTGTWKVSGAPDPWASNSVFNNGGNTFRWSPGLDEAGDYAVYAWWTYHANRSSNVPYRIAHAGGTATEYRNQADPGLGGQWVLLGIYSFTGDGSGYIEISSENGQASADAVRLIKQ